MRAWNVTFFVLVIVVAGGSFVCSSMISDDSSPQVTTESSPLDQFAGPAGVLPKPERELPPLPPTPPLLESELSASSVGHYTLSKISCEKVLQDGMIKWSMEIPSGLFTAADPILFDQFDLYEGELGFVGIEDSQSVLVYNEIESFRDVEFGDGWFRYYLGTECRYIVKFCSAYWDISQASEQVYAVRLATPPWIP